MLENLIHCMSERGGEEGILSRKILLWICWKNEEKAAIFFIYFPSSCIYVEGGACDEIWPFGGWKLMLYWIIKCTSNRSSKGNVFSIYSEPWLWRTEKKMWFYGCFFFPVREENLKFITSCKIARAWGKKTEHVSTIQLQK